jgi:uncharacterized protein
MTTSLRHLILAGAVLAVTSPVVLADQKTHRKAAEELLKAMGVDKQVETALAQMLDLQIKNNPGLAPFRGAMKEFFTKHMSWDSLKDDLITIYTDAFTEEELKEILAFYRTRVGRKMVEKTPDLLSKGMQLGVRRVQENQGELRRMIQDAGNKPEPGNK